MENPPRGYTVYKRLKCDVTMPTKSELLKVVSTETKLVGSQKVGLIWFGKYRDRKVDRRIRDTKADLQKAGQEG